MEVIRQLEKVYKALNFRRKTCTARCIARRTDVASRRWLPTGDAAFEAARRELEGLAARSVAERACDRPGTPGPRGGRPRPCRSRCPTFRGRPARRPAAGNQARRPQGSADGSFEGLDARHGELLAAILDAGPLPRPKSKRVAKSMKLLVDGAMDHINEWAFDRLDGAVVEDGDEFASRRNWPTA